MREASQARAARLREEISDLIKQAAQPTESAGAREAASLRTPSPREFIQKRMAQLGGIPKPPARSGAKKKK